SLSLRTLVGESPPVQMKNPEALLSCCSRPAVRVRPLPTYIHRILAYAVLDLSLDSGLATNRNNRSTPRDSDLPLTCLLFSSTSSLLLTVAAPLLPCAAGAEQ